MCHAVGGGVSTLGFTGCLSAFVTGRVRGGHVAVGAISLLMFVCGVTSNVVTVMMCVITVITCVITVITCVITVMTCLLTDV